MIKRVCLCVVVTLLTGVSLSQEKQNVDLIVSGGIVVTMDSARAIYQDGGVAVRGDSIVAVGPRAEIEARYQRAGTAGGAGVHQWAYACADELISWVA